MIIEDGRGSGKKAKIDVDNRLAVSSRSESIQHYVSHEEEQAYQILTDVTVAAGMETIALHVKNIAIDKDLVITYCRHQFIASAGTFPDTGNYYKIGFGKTYNSGGTTVEPVNVFLGSGNLAEVEVFTQNPTITGAEVIIDKWYTKDTGDMNTFNKEGSVIISPGKTIELSYVSNDAEGNLYTRLSFLMKNKTN